MGDPVEIIARMNQLADRLTFTEIADGFGVSARTLRRWRRAGRFPTYAMLVLNELESGYATTEEETE